MSNSKYVEALAVLALLVGCVSPQANAQGWASTATKAFPAEYLPNATLVGPLAAATPIHVVLGLQAQNAAQIQPTLQSLNGAALTFQQFVTQFGATAAQVQAVQNYLTSMGFTHLTVADNQLLIDGYGTAAEVEKAFNTSLAEYSVNGANVYMNTSAAQVPASLSGVVIAVLGLNSVASLHSDIAHLSLAPMTVPCKPPQCPTPDLSNESYGPKDYQIAYDAACPANNPTCPADKFPGGGYTAVGIIAEGDLTQVVTDLRTYETNNSLPQVPVTVVNAGVASADTSGQDEWDLDSQTSTGIAERVAHLYFYVATSMTDSDLALAIGKAVSQNKVKAFNMSFGECEFFPYIDGSMLVDDQSFAEAALQGITPFASADDQGSACPVVGTNGVPLSGPPDTAYPASSPYVIAVGGTNMFSNANYTYDFETGWEASGGGISYFETAPFWQSYTGGGSTPIVPSAEAGQRGVPDVAMCAGGSELAICAANIIVDGKATLVGGTSLSSPLAMGSWARIQTAHKNALGFAGPLIYQLATSGPPARSPHFNDVTIGSNGLFSCLPGYDYVTGLGSFDALRISRSIPSTYPQ
jgi:subtilase family serine protease